MSGDAGPEVSAADRSNRVPPREAPGGRTPAEPPDPPYKPAELDADRFKLTTPVTLEDMAELQRRIREHGGGSVEVFCHGGADVVVDVRWPNGARIRKTIRPITL